MSSINRYKTNGGSFKHSRLSSNLQEPYQFRITIDNTEKSNSRSHGDDNEIDESNIDINRNETTAVEIKNRTSIFSRLGDVSSKSNNGTTVLFENLNDAVISDDIKDLCESVGEIKSVEVVKSPGTHLIKAEVIFARRSAGLEAIKKFHGVKLDGIQMIVKLKGEKGKDNPFNPVDLASSTISTQKNVKLGFFGTAIEPELCFSDNDAYVNHSVRFTPSRSVKDSQKSISFNSSTRNNRKSIRSQNEKGTASSKKSASFRLSDNDLDVELDRYMKSH